jgi:hypothetical protein
MASINIGITSLSADVVPSGRVRVLLREHMYNKALDSNISLIFFTLNTNYNDFIKKGQCGQKSVFKITHYLS